MAPLVTALDDKIAQHIKPIDSRELPNEDIVDMLLESVILFLHIVVIGPHGSQLFFEFLLCLGLLLQGQKMGLDGLVFRLAALLQGVVLQLQFLVFFLPFLQL